MPSAHSAPASYAPHLPLASATLSQVNELMLTADKRLAQVQARLGGGAARHTRSRPPHLQATLEQLQSASDLTVSFPAPQGKRGIEHTAQLVTRQEEARHFIAGEQRPSWH